MSRLKSTTTITIAALLASTSSIATSAELGIEEITITAQKRSESLQNAPLAVTAFSAERLEEDGISNLQDIGNRTPGLVFAALSAGQPEIAIRGVGTKEDGAGASDSTVISVDDVYIAARTAQVFDIFDLERVEVLRGPQGTLYGKNSAAGSINFVTTKPTDEVRVKVRQSYGNYDRFDTAALISGPITDNLFGKFSFSRRKHDGYIRNILPGHTDPVTNQYITNPNFGKRQGGSNTFAWRSQLRWIASDTLEITLSADGADDKLGADHREPIGSLGALHGCGCASDPVAVNMALGGAASPWTSLAETEGFTDREVFGSSLKVEYDMDWATFSSISSYRESDFNWLFDSTGLPPSNLFVDLSGSLGNPNTALFGDASNGFTFDVNDIAIEDTEQLTQELRLTSPGAEKIDWVAGLFFSKEEINRQERYPFTALSGPGLLPSDWTSVQHMKSESVAAYGQATYHVTDNFGITAGLRYSWEKKKYTGININNNGGSDLLLKEFIDPVTNLPRAADASKSWENVSWKVVADYQLDTDVMTYASVSTGFKTGGFTGSASTLEQQETPFDEETVTNYELGVKSLWFERRLMLNISAFYMDYKDLQVTRFFRPVGAPYGQFITENAGIAKIKGVELEYTLLPFNGAELGGSYAYLDAEYKTFTGTPDFAGASDFAGNQLRQSPKHQLNIYAKYTQPLQNNMGSLSGKIDYRYQSLSYYDPDNNPITSMPSYDIWNARLAWVSDNDQWEIAAWIRNLTNEKYLTHTFSQRGGQIAFASFGDPRTYGVTVTFSY